MRMQRLHIALIVVLGAGLLAAAAVIIHQSNNLADLQQQRETALQSLRKTREELHQSQLRLSGALRKPAKPANDEKATIARRDATIAQLTKELSAAQAGITQFQEKLAAAKKENEKAAANSNQRYQELQSEMQGHLDKLHKALSSAQSDLQKSQQRVADLEKGNAKLQADNSTRSTRVAEREHLLVRLQDLDRRRESYLRSIGNRYRSITSRFQTMSGMLDANRGQGSGTAFSGAALDLIQNALSQSDDDLQHLSDLNAKAFQIEKELSKK